MASECKDLRQKILADVETYTSLAFPETEFIPGSTPIPVSGKVFDHTELQHVVSAGLDFWLTEGRYVSRFTKEFSSYVGLRHCVLTNSGSSANLLALSALTSPKLGERALHPGDEVITTALAFPTTVNPIVQNGCVPVFIDALLPTYNIDVSKLEESLSPKTKAIMVAHTLGNPFDLATVKSFADAHNLWLIEDCCDAVGSEYDEKKVGTFGDIATVSFFPAHHITMGEGGAVLTDDDKLKSLISSFNNWGRDCWCPPGASNSCGKRFSWKLGDLPEGYDHKYIFTHRGYNLKLTDLQAAVGCAQLQKLPDFVRARRENFTALRDGIQDLDTVLLLPESLPQADPSWFGFPISVQEGSSFTRDDLIAHLEEKMIATRMLFSGNILRHPAYADTPYRTIGAMTGADTVMNTSFWIGVYPGITPAMREYMIETIRDFCFNQR